MIKKKILFTALSIMWLCPLSGFADTISFKPVKTFSVSTIFYTGFKPVLTVSTIVYKGKPMVFKKGDSNSRPPLLNSLSKIHLDIIQQPSGKMVFSPGTKIPLKVKIHATVKPDLIFEFQLNNGRTWRKIGPPRFDSQKITRGKGKIILTRHVTIVKSGKYRWRCGLKNGSSWSSWSVPLTISPKTITKKPVKNRKIPPKKLKLKK